MPRKWVGGAVAVVAVLVLAGQCAGAGTPDQVPAASPTPTAVPVQPALAAPLPTTVPPVTAPPTTRPAPTTPRPAPTTTPAPQPEPRPQPRPQPQPAASEGDDEDSSGSVSYKNCSAVRAAGADPIRRGDPGYGSHLDRDGDGVGCE